MSPEIPDSEYPSDSGISGDKTQASQGSADYWIVKTEADGTTCPLPTSLYVTNLTITSAKLNWDAVPIVIGYKVRYKVAGTSEWTNIQSIDNDKTLHGLTASTKYVWQVKSICSTPPVVSSDWSEKQFFTTGSLRSGALEDVSFPIEMDIYPNPFMVSTTISFSLQQDSRVLIELYDVAGRKMTCSDFPGGAVLDENVPAGNHELNLYREQMSAGIYFLKANINGNIITRKLIIE